MKNRVERQWGLRGPGVVRANRLTMGGVHNAPLVWRPKLLSHRLMAGYDHDVALCADCLAEVAVYTVDALIAGPLSHCKARWMPAVAAFGNGSQEARIRTSVASRLVAIPHARARPATASRSPGASVRCALRSSAAAG